jgi:hypothetical protein
MIPLTMKQPFRNTMPKFGRPPMAFKKAPFLFHGIQWAPTQCKHKLQGLSAVGKACVTVGYVTR